MMMMMQGTSETSVSPIRSEAPNSSSNETGSVGAYTNTSGGARMFQKSNQSE